MHSALLSTSSHAIAARHYSRMTAFAQSSSSSSSLHNATSTSDAQAQLHAAELELGDRMKELHRTFSDLMRRTLRPASAHALGSPSRRSSEVSSSDLQVLRDRIRQLERKMEDAPPPRDISAPPPPSPSVKGKEKATTQDEAERNDGPSGKRSRARALLEDMSIRLQAVEGMKDSLENRYVDLENMVNAKIQDEMEIERMGNRSWRVIEDLRDPDGSLRGIKRKRAERDERMAAEEGRMTIDTLASPSRISAISASGPDSGVAQLQEQVAALEQFKPEITTLASRVLALETAHPAPSGAAGAPMPSARDREARAGPDRELLALQQQVADLEAELAGIKAQEAEREKSMMDSLSDRLHKEFDGLVEEVSHVFHSDPPHSLHPSIILVIWT